MKRNESACNKKQEQEDLRWTSNKVLKSLKEVIDLSESDKWFQSDGALSLKALLPISYRQSCNLTSMES